MTEPEQCSGCDFYAWFAVTTVHKLTEEGTVGISVRGIGPATRTHGDSLMAVAAQIVEALQAQPELLDRHVAEVTQGAQEMASIQRQMKERLADLQQRAQEHDEQFAQFLSTAAS